MYLMTVSEATRATGLSAASIRRMIARSDVPHMAVGGRIVVDIDALKAFIASAERPNLIGITELTELTGLSYGAVRRGIHEGWLSAEQCGHKYLLDRDTAINEIMARLRGDGGGRA